MAKGSAKRPGKGGAPPSPPDPPPDRQDLFGGAQEEAAPLPAPGRTPPSDLDLRHGHRARLRDRFLSGGGAAVADYELLELVLFRAIPRRDVNPLAKRMIARFGGFAEALAAPIERLREVDGLGEAAITELKIVEAAAQQLTRERALGRPALSSWDALLDYCRATMAHQPVERFHVLYLDKKNVLIADEEQSRGTIDQAAVYPREVIKRALELDASALILVHNHPSGDPTPSRADIEVTRQIITAAQPFAIEIHDHVIIGKQGAESLRALGRL